MPPLTWRWLQDGDVAAVWDLHRVAVARAPEPGLVKPEKPGFFERMTGADGLMIGGFAGTALVAYGVLQWGLSVEDDPRCLFGLPADADLAKLAGSSVHPDWRGLGLHAGIIGQRKTKAAELGYRHLYATTDPANWRSWTNLVDAGFAVRRLVQKYGNLWRFLLHHDRARGEMLPSGTADPRDFSGLTDRLEKGEQGIGWDKVADGTVLLRFGRLP